MKNFITMLKIDAPIILVALVFGYLTFGNMPALYFSFATTLLVMGLALCLFFEKRQTKEDIKDKQWWDDYNAEKKAVIDAYTKRFGA